MNANADSGHAGKSMICNRLSANASSKYILLKIDLLVALIDAKYQQQALLCKRKPSSTYPTYTTASATIISVPCLTTCPRFIGAVLGQ